MFVRQILKPVTTLTANIRNNIEYKTIREVWTEHSQTWVVLKGPFYGRKDLNTIPGEPTLNTNIQHDLLKYLTEYLLTS